MTLSAAGARVLVVEDREDVQAIATAILSRLGCSIIVAPTGRAAIAVLEDDPSMDLLFSDIMLPGGVSGLDLAREVRQRWPEIAILLTTGYPGPEDVRATARAEGLAIIAKPYRMADLAERVREALGTRTLIRD
jgi:CheY-like chemotaxis protein